MGALRLILGDQLSLNLSSLADCDKEKDTLLMVEVAEETTYVKHHKKKIAFLLSAMRHHALRLQEEGYRLRYVRLDDPDNSGSFSGEVERALKDLGHSEAGTADRVPKRIIITFPGEHRVLKDMQSWEQRFGLPVDMREDDRFLCTPEAFARWADGRKQLRMEFFYREMRKRHQVLMAGNTPEGGQWNFDAENRKPPKEGLLIPQAYTAEPDDISREVMALVGERFRSHFGDLEPFFFAVTRDQALACLDRFIDERLHRFGDYQDAMLQGEPWMFHAHISFYLNCGLLDPMECIRAAERAYYQGDAPLNAVEGFIRQILGWREFVHGLYWLKMPDYATENYFEADRDLPALFWGQETQMNCLRQCVRETWQNAYAHHIQRLMVLGNFALLAGLDPEQVNEWYLIVYADAYEWVEMPNVTGMILFADGGTLASKPYAASGSYINKMSDYCGQCSYQVSKKNGPKACPFNYLYWDFLARNRDKLKSNQRLAMVYRTYDRMGEEKKRAISDDSRRFLKDLA